MTKRRIYWPYGNPESDAWQLEAVAGPLVVRRNHPLVRTGRPACQGWDVWLAGRYVGAFTACSLLDLAELPRRQLKASARAACCARHHDYSTGSSASRPNWGGRRPNAGRRPTGDAKRVDLATTVDRATLALIDDLRGSASRGQFLDRVVRAHAGR